MSNNPRAFSPSVSGQPDQGIQPDSTTVGRPLPKKRASRAKAPPKGGNTVEKKKATRGKRNTGKLAALLDLPLDCLFEVRFPRLSFMRITLTRHSSHS